MSVPTYVFCVNRTARDTFVYRVDLYSVDLRIAAAVQQSTRRITQQFARQVMRTPKDYLVCRPGASAKFSIAIVFFSGPISGLPLCAYARAPRLLSPPVQTGWAPYSGWLIRNQLVSPWPRTVKSTAPAAKQLVAGA